MMGRIDSEQTKRQEASMNRYQQTFAASRYEGLLTGSSPGFKPERKLEDYFAPSP